MIKIINLIQDIKTVYNLILGINNNPRNINNK